MSSSSVSSIGMLGTVKESRTILRSVSKYLPVDTACKMSLYQQHLKNFNLA